MWCPLSRYFAFSAVKFESQTRQSSFYDHIFCWRFVSLKFQSLRKFKKWILRMSVWIDHVMRKFAHKAKTQFCLQRCFFSVNCQVQRDNSDDFIGEFLKWYYWDKAIWVEQCVKELEIFLLKYWWLKCRSENIRMSNVTWPANGALIQIMNSIKYSNIMKHGDG